METREGGRWRKQGAARRQQTPTLTRAEPSPAIAFPSSFWAGEAQQPLLMGTQGCHWAAPGRDGGPARGMSPTPSAPVRGRSVQLAQP